jgi:uncharacterized protein (DUF1778 family)
MSVNSVIQITTTRETKDLIKRAAEVSGVTVSAFAIQAALEEAKALLLPNLADLLSDARESSLD